ncbi:MAG: ATP-grasp domain-containing protein [Candidatus Sulfotelmatobacter sp.]|jgi:hypothetical protein
MGGPAVKPAILIAATSRWMPTARLAMALAQAGCVVDAVCPSGHPIEKINGIRRTYRYHGLLALQSISEAIAAAKPALIIPGDDLVTSHLHQLHRHEADRSQTGQAIRTLIELSLGSPESFRVVYERAEFIELARRAGIRAPRMKVISRLAELDAWAARTGFPTVLKANGTSGGDGVRIVRKAEDAERALRTLQSPPSPLRAAKRAIVDHDKTLLWPAVLRRRFVVNAQEYIAGREATSAVACWQGKVMASLHFEVLNKRDSAGPSSVLRLIENAEMAFAAETVVRELKLSGLHGFDFMLESGSGNAHLIEINPRATQVGHLTLGPGRDLPAALYAALTGEAVHPAAKLTEKDTIALFPQEWTRDPASPFLQSGYHDVPWDEPELLRACAGKRKEQLALKLQQVPAQSLTAVQAPRLP